MHEREGGDPTRFAPWAGRSRWWMSAFKTRLGGATTRNTMTAPFRKQAVRFVTLAS